MDRKIGRGTIGNRFKAAQTSNYRALYLRLITRFDDSVDLRVVQAERILHKVFHFLNIRGEWFEVHDSLEWFIGVPIKWPVLLEWLRSREDPQAYLLEAFSAYANNINNPKPGEFSF